MNTTDENHAEQYRWDNDEDDACIVCNTPAFSFDLDDFGRCGDCLDDVEEYQFLKPTM